MRHNDPVVNDMSLVRPSAAPSSNIADQRNSAKKEIFQHELGGVKSTMNTDGFLGVFHFHWAICNESETIYSARC